MTSLVVLVTGGSGFLGQHVIKHLQLYADTVKEIRVLDLVPYEKNLDFAESKPVKSYTGNITDIDVVSAACKGVDAVLHLASVIDSTMFPNKNLLEEVNVKGAETVLAACKQCNVPTLIYCSSIAAMQGFTEVKAGTETSISVPDTLMFEEYGSTKYTAQTMVLNANGTKLNDGKAMKTLAILPLTMYGELDNNLTHLLKSFRGKDMPKLGPMKAYVHFAYVGNVAIMFVKALQSLENNPELGGQYFFGADDTPACSATGFIKPFLEGINAGISGWYLPVWFLYLVITLIYFVLLVIRPIKKLNVPVTCSSVAFSNTTFYVTYDKAKTLLGYKPMYDYETSLHNATGFYSKM